MLPALAIAGCSSGDRRGHQAGIATPPQAHLLLQSMDVVRDAELPATIKAWAAAMPAGVSFTLGMGPRLVRGLADLPAFARDRLEPARCGGDLIVQLCADDRALLQRTALQLTRQDVARPRWQQAGSHHPRNLFGFRDGIANPAGAELDEHVWTPEGGTYMVVRRIRMDIDGFAGLPLAEQEAAIGRHRDSGAPLGGTVSADEINLFAKVATGAYVIPLSAHVRRANPLALGGARILRRGYNYVDGPQDQGLAFVSFQKTPQTFIDVQRRLAADAMMAHTTTVGSAVFYVPPSTDLLYGLRPRQ